MRCAIFYTIFKNYSSLHHLHTELADGGFDRILRLQGGHPGSLPGQCTHLPAGLKMQRQLNAIRFTSRSNSSMFSRTASSKSACSTGLYHVFLYFNFLSTALYNKMRSNPPPLTNPQQPPHLRDAAANHFGAPAQASGRPRGALRGGAGSQRFPPRAQAGRPGPVSRPVAGPACGRRAARRAGRWWDGLGRAVAQRRGAVRPRRREVGQNAVLNDSRALSCSSSFSSPISFFPLTLELVFAQCSCVGATIQMQSYSNLFYSVWLGGEVLGVVVHSLTRVLHT